MKYAVLFVLSIKIKKQLDNNDVNIINNNNTFFTGKYINNLYLNLQTKIKCLISTVSFAPVFICLEIGV